MKKWKRVSILVLFLFMSQFSVAMAQEPVVRVILLYSPACPHCQKIISEDLPPLINQYGGVPDVLYIPPSPQEEPVGPSLVGIFGDSLEILYVNGLTELGHELYSSVVELFSIPSELQVVPIMIVGENLLIGGGEITAQLPGIIEEGLAKGGIDWIDLPGLAEAIGQLIPAPTEPSPTDEPTQGETQASAPPTENTETVPAQVATSTPQGSVATSTVDPASSLLEPEFSILDRIKMDPVGNSVAIVVLIGMIISIAFVGSRILLPESQEEARGVSWLIPVLCVIGMGVAAYLTYVETSGTEAVCGPVGDCNTVQESKYALLFGFIPVGALGLAGYIVMVVTWFFTRFGKEPLIQWAKVALLGLSLFGTLFSIYLTFLEPFVIGATCAWCITSALIMTILLWLTVGPGTDALARLRGEAEEITE